MSDTHSGIEGLETVCPKGGRGQRPKAKESLAPQAAGQSRVSSQLLVKITVFLRSCLFVPGTDIQR